jgi:cytochrome P450
MTGSPFPHIPQHNSPRSPVADAARADQWILDGVVDVARPRARLKPCRDLGHLPGDRGLLAGLRTIAGMFRHGEAYFIRQHQRYGPVYRTQLGPDPIVCVADPDLALAILRNQDGAWSAALGWRLVFDGLVGGETMDMLATLDFEPHRETRGLLQPAFSSVALQSYIGTALDAFDRDLPDWFEHRRVRFKPAVRRLFANVASRVFMGIDDPAEAERLDHALAAFWRGPMALVRNPLLSPTWRKARRGERMLREWLRSQVEPRRAGAHGTDLFSRLCQTPNDLEWLDDDALVRLFLGVMVAAFDTTSLGVAGMGYLLAIHPEWQERLRTECRRVDAEELRRSDLEELEEMDWVWMESLRLLPVAGDVPRVALRDVQLGDYRFPAGTFVLPRLGALHRHPDWWTEPEKFDPERFSASRAEHKRHRGIYLPFGGGVHACIGALLASIEAKAFFHRLLSRGRFRLAGAAQGCHQYRPLGQVSGNVELILEPA